MWDLISILASIAFFVVAIEYVRGCDKLWARLKLFSVGSVPSCWACIWSTRCCAPNAS